jgi:hypothetical protein
MPTPLPDRDCLDCTPEEMALAERLGLEGRERIMSRMLSGTPLLVSVRMEADHVSDAWAHYDVKVQLRAIQIAFDVLHHGNPNGPS